MCRLAECSPSPFVSDLHPTMNTRDMDDISRAARNRVALKFVEALPEDIRHLATVPEGPIDVEKACEIARYIIRLEPSVRVHCLPGQQ